MTTMKAARYFPPGGPEKIELKQEPIPADPQPNQVLIKVHAVGLIHPELTWPIYQSPTGEYLPHIPGHDFSGTITKLGSNVTTPGLVVDAQVCAFTSRRNHEGAMAEYALADADQVVPKPASLDLDHAGALPLSALTAWQALFEHGGLTSGQRVLITGAAGGTGVFAVQFARHVGAHVIGTGSSAKSREILAAFGVDEFVDYKTQDLKEAVREVDLVLDTVGGAVFEAVLGVVRKGGLVISINEFNAERTAEARGVRAKFFIVSMNTDQLGEIGKLVDAGKVKTIVDRVVPLSKVREAFEEAAKGHSHGKVIIKVAE